MSVLRYFLASGLSLSAVLACATLLLIWYSKRRGAALLLLAAALFARAGHQMVAIWIRYVAAFHPQRVGQWSLLRFSDVQHPPGLGYHVWQNSTGIDNLFYPVSYVLLIVLMGFELRARRDDRVRSDLKRELDHSI